MTKAAKAAHQQRMDQIHSEAIQQVATGCCPDCGSGLRQNLSISGWWQCVCYGAEGFRKAGSQPCSWQAFTC